MLWFLIAALSLPEALRIFRERGFDLLLAQEQVESAQGELQIAAAIANPQLTGSAGKSFDYDPGACAGCSAAGPSTFPR